MPRSLSLSLAAVDVMSQILRVNCRLYPFEIPSFGQYEQDRTAIARAVLSDLQSRGLLDNDELDRDMRDALEVTADHDIAVAMSGTVDQDRQVRARVAAAGSTAVLAVQEGQSIRFELISPAALARTLVSLLPPAPAGPGQSVQVVQPPPQRPDAHDQGGFTQRVNAPRSTADAQVRMAATMLERPRRGVGFFAVTAKGRHGREIDAGSVGWIDTDAGRYLMLTKPSPDGEIRATYSPADSARLTRQLGDLIESAAPRR